MDLIVDTNILSTFAKLDRIGLLKQLFPKSQLYVPPSVNKEIIQVEKMGYDFIKNARKGGELKVIGLTREESKKVRAIRKTSRVLGVAEIECLVLAESRGMVVLSNDSKVKSEASKRGVEYLDLPMILRFCWKSGVWGKEEVVSLIDEIESKDRIRIVNKKMILE